MLGSVIGKKKGLIRMPPFATSVRAPSSISG